MRIGKSPTHTEYPPEKRDFPCSRGGKKLFFHPKLFISKYLKIIHLIFFARCVSCFGVIVVVVRLVKAVRVTGPPSFFPPASSAKPNPEGDRIRSFEPAESGFEAHLHL